MLAKPDLEQPGVDFRPIFEREFDYVWCSLRRLGVCDRDLEDVAHDVFVEVSRQLHRYDPRRPVRPWLFAFAFRFASDYRRLARHKVEVIAEREAEDPAVSAEDVLIEREAHALLARAIQHVEIERRAVFVLHELDEVPIPEVAHSLGIPLNTAYSRLRVAREEFTAAARRLRGGRR